MNKNRIIWIFLSLVMFAIFLPVSISTYKDRMVYKEGNIVEVVITYLPISTTSKGGFIKFSLDGVVYDKKINASTIALLHVGDKIKLKYLKEYSSHFLFPNENPLSGDLGALAMILLAAVWGLYYACKKNPPSIGRRLTS